MRKNLRNANIIIINEDFQKRKYFFLAKKIAKIGQI